MIRFLCILILFVGCSIKQEDVTKSEYREIYYSQLDPRWRHAELGRSGQNFGQIGCTVASTAMALEALGFKTNPLVFTRYLNQNRGFTSSGLLIWKAVEAFTGNQVKVSFPRPSMNRVKSELERGNQVLIRVFLGRIPHWVLADEFEGDELWVWDPLRPKQPRVPLADLAPRVEAIRIIQPH